MKRLLIVLMLVGTGCRDAGRSDLEARVSALEARLGVGDPVLDRWRSLQIMMSQQEVRAILGEPTVPTYELSDKFAARSAQMLREQGLSVLPVYPRPLWIYAYPNGNGMLMFQLATADEETSAYLMMIVYPPPGTRAKQ